LIFESKTICPFCKNLCNRSMAEESQLPENGDCSICLKCGCASTFDDTAEGGLRKPTAEESTEWAQDSTYRMYMEAWTNANKPKRFL
jgi:hypothetical protein